jgi:ATP/maltotriose-dependent transcriptional regulator MalT
MSGGGWHGWLWRLRFAQLRAELAAAHGAPDAAIDLARDALQQSRSRRRTKYEVYARVTLGSQLATTGRTAEALRELATAVRRAEQLRNPALHVLAAGTLLAIEPHDDVAAAAHASVERVLASLADTTMRCRFLDAEPVGVITRTTKAERLV